MLKSMTAVVVAASVVVSGCATAPGNISAAYVSPNQYATYSCDALNAEAGRLRAKVSEVTGIQQQKATSDTVSMTVGMLLFWPALFFLASGKDRSAELAQLKGEVQALDQAWNMKSCAQAPVAAAAAS